MAIVEGAEMKLIFLDIDGVLNAHEPIDPEVLSALICRQKASLLNGVLRATGAKIVLTSAWRYLIHRGEMNLDGFDWLLRSHGLIARRLAGITRDDTMEGEHWPKENERGQQVADWLVASDEPCGGYVVIDDMDLGISAAGHPFIQTDGKVGLTQADAEKAIQLLSRERGVADGCRTSETSC